MSDLESEYSVGPNAPPRSAAACFPLMISNSESWSILYRGARQNASVVGRLLVMYTWATIARGNHGGQSAAESVRKEEKMNGPNSLTSVRMACMEGHGIAWPWSVKCTGHMAALGAASELDAARDVKWSPLPPPPAFSCKRAGAAAAAAVVVVDAAVLVDAYWVRDAPRAAV